MRTFFGIVVILFVGFLFRGEIMDAWEVGDFGKELEIPENVTKADLEAKIGNLKTSLLDLQDKLETKKDEGVAKVQEIKDTIEETQKAIEKLQQSIEDLQESGEKVKGLFSGEK